MDTQISFEELSRRGKEILDKQGPVTFERAKEQVERLKKGSYLHKMTEQEIREKLTEVFSSFRSESPRRIRILTGPGGMDLYEETMQADCGMKRVYTNKVPRFTRMLKWRKSEYTGRYYRLLKMSL